MNSTSMNPAGQAVVPHCLLCGRPASLIGIFTPHDQPRRVLAYWLCCGHPVNQDAIDQVDGIITMHLSAMSN